MFSNKMVTPATPERVYTLCKILEKKPMTAAEAREKMEPDFLASGSTPYFQDYRTAAEELGLISLSDNMLSLAVPSDTVSSIDAMRMYANSKLPQFQEGHFYKVTRAYFDLGSSVFSGEKNLSNLAPQMSQKIRTDQDKGVDAMEMRAWRFWVTFLGFGYLQDMFFIPNADVYLRDVISLSSLEKGKIYSFSDFVDSLLPYAGIVLNTGLSKHEFNYGVSNGLRTLHDQGIIKMEHILDYEDIWTLYPMKAHALPGTVTNITICE